jgi:putative membrane protein
VKIIVKLLACVAAVFLMGQIMPRQIHYDGIAALLITGVILWLINLLIRPILKLIALPLTLLTLGLFSLVINTLMVMLADVLIPGTDFGGFWPSFLIALAVSVLEVVLGKIFKEER